MDLRLELMAHTLAFQVQRAVMGEDNPRVTFTLDNLGYSHSKNKDYARALKVSCRDVPSIVRS